jgi:hypothetical protein
MQKGPLRVLLPLLKNLVLFGTCRAFKQGLEPVVDVTATYDDRPGGAGLSISTSSLAFNFQVVGHNRQTRDHQPLQ